MSDNQNNIYENDESKTPVENNNFPQSEQNTTPIEDGILDTPQEDTPADVPPSEEAEAPAGDGVLGVSQEETPSDVPQEETPESKEEYAFKWNYENIQNANEYRKPRRKRAGLIFGIIASAAFVFAIIALVVAVILGTANGWFNLNASNGAPSVDFNTQINVSDQVPETTPPEDDASAEIIEKFKHSTVVVICDSGTGTGIILDDNGMIVTNHHVIENSTAINVYLYDGRSYSATLIGSDAYNDIAVIKINAPDLSPATFANSDNTYTGQKVYAVGTPAGPEFAWSVSAGIVSHPSRELKFYNDQGQLERSLFLIQTDALVNPGNSGGPLVNANCEVMGIVTMRLSDDYVGMGFAIPTNVALPIIENIIKNYKAPSKLPTSSAPQLGISGIVVEKGELFMMSDMGFKDIVTEDYYNRNPDRCKKATHAGIYVLATTEGFDAASKLQVGDIIIAADKVTVTSMESLKNVITSKKVGDTMSVTVVRNNQQIKIDVVLGKAVQ